MSKMLLLRLRVAALCCRVALAKHSRQSKARGGLLNHELDWEKSAEAMVPAIWKMESKSEKEKLAERLRKYGMGWTSGCLKFDKEALRFIRV